jgi:hypothetical protein
VGHHNGAFVGIDTSKLRNAVAVAEEGRGGDVHYLGEIDTTETSRIRPSDFSRLTGIGCRPCSGHAAMEAKGLIPWPPLSL